LRLAAETRPDVALMDIRMPRLDGLAATRELHANPNPPRVIVLTTFELDDYVFDALRAGAAGFLLKTTPPRDLAAAVKACAAGETTLGPSVIARLVDSYVNTPHEPVAEIADLTERELDVLRAMARGLSNSEIGRELYLAETTVKTHVARILGKLGVRDRVQAVVLAHRSGLVLD
jgi:DNA-binding NarL/FixJ family response regulator